MTGTSADRAARQVARRERRAAVTDPDVVMAAAAALLATRSWSIHDLRRRLVTLGYRGDLIGTVVERLVALGYLDDQRYAAAWVASRDRSRPRGSLVLRRELQRRGLEPSVIETALAERDAVVEDPDDLVPGAVASADVAAARHLVERRGAALAREPDARRRRQRAYALLARNGFDPETCAEVAAAWAGAEA
jgi:regulatory protein